jgi:hypothetical protein
LLALDIPGIFKVSRQKKGFIGVSQEVFNGVVVGFVVSLKIKLILIVPVVFGVEGVLYCTAIVVDMRAVLMLSDFGMSQP